MRRYAAERRKWLWQGTASALLLLLLGILFAPLAAAGQDGPPLPACCRSAHGCNLHLHHAARADANGHHIAALQPVCPCVPLAASGIAGHVAAEASTREDRVCLPSSRAPADDAAAFIVPLLPGGDATRGPPAAMLAA